MIHSPLFETEDLSNMVWQHIAKTNPTQLPELAKVFTFFGNYEVFLTGGWVYEKNAIEYRPSTVTMDDIDLILYTSSYFFNVGNFVKAVIEHLPKWSIELVGASEYSPYGHLAFIDNRIKMTNGSLFIDLQIAKVGRKISKCAADKYVLNSGMYYHYKAQEFSKQYGLLLNAFENFRLDILFSTNVP